VPNGGRRRARYPSGANWFAPTVFTTCRRLTTHRARGDLSARCCRCLTFRTPAEAVEKANNTPYGLSPVSGPRRARASCGSPSSCEPASSGQYVQPLRFRARRSAATRSRLRPRGWPPRFCTLPTKAQPSRRSRPRLPSACGSGRPTSCTWRRVPPFGVGPASYRRSTSGRPTARPASRRPTHLAASRVGAPARGQVALARVSRDARPAVATPFGRRRWAARVEPS